MLSFIVDISCTAQKLLSLVKPYLFYFCFLLLGVMAIISLSLAFLVSTWFLLSSPLVSPSNIQGQDLSGIWNISGNTGEFWMFIFGFLFPAGETLGQKEVPLVQHWPPKGGGWCSQSHFSFPSNMVFLDCCGPWECLRPFHQVLGLLSVDSCTMASCLWIVASWFSYEGNWS